MPQERGRSASPSRMRGRSNSPSARMSRARSGSLDPSRIRGRSNSPSQKRSSTRGRSSSPSRMRGRSSSVDPLKVRGRSNSPGGRSRSGSAERSGKGGIRKGGKRNKSSTAEGESSGGRGKFHKGRKVLAKAPKQIGKGIKKAPKRIGRGIKKAPKQIGKGIKQGGRQVKRGGRYIKQRIAPKQECPMWKVCAYAVPIVIILGCSLGLISATGSRDKFTPTFVSNLIPKLDGKDVVDPYSGGGLGGGSTSIAKWNNGDAGGGLSIDILNAMTSEWQKFFDLAISDYDFGNPDSLTLNGQKIKEDKKCSAVQGKIKVCNGDYGETKWRGINSQNFDSGGFIISSTARMNEFYLLYDVDAAKQYTLCHELGHAFGLAHTDEEFGNEDLGNCLDYTDNFEVNKHPDVSNYEVLASLYGTVGTRRRRRRQLLRAASPTGSNTTTTTTTTTTTQVSESLWTKMHEAVEKLAARLDDNAHEDGWKLLHRNRHGEEHELELEEGYRVRVHMLLAQQP